jgi:hypothetical protein
MTESSLGGEGRTFQVPGTGYNTYSKIRLSYSLKISVISTHFVCFASIITPVLEEMANSRGRQ